MRVIQKITGRIRKMSDRHVTPEALRRVEKKIDEFADSQRKVNERVFDTMDQLNKTLASLDKNIALSTEKFSLVHEKSRQLEARTAKLESKYNEAHKEIQAIKLEAHSVSTGLKVTKWIVFSAIPIIISLIISIIRIA